MPQTATEKMRAFLRSGKYLAPENLADYSSDYRSCPPLGPVETADMRHHRERLREASTAAQADTPRPTLEPLPDRDIVELPDRPEANPISDAHLLALSAGRCLHRYARREVCRRCIESCSAGAIHSGDDTPRIEYAACLGCAACVSACPTGAIRWLPTNPQEVLQHMQDALSPHVDRGSPPPIVAFIRKGIDPPTTTREAPPLVIIEVATIGIVGAAVLLSAMAMGAAGVFILVDDTAGDSLRRRLSEEIRWSLRLLTAWGYSDGSIGLLPSTSGTVQLPTGLTGYGVPPVPYPFDPNVRFVSRRAAEHLAGHGPDPGIIVPLPDGTPFGTVQIDGSRCTLCMACAGACRLHALVARNGDAPGLGFTESLCVQCGACAMVCPEQAITLVPRMNPDPVGTAECLPLHQTQPARCSVCGRVFASSQMLSSIQRKLRGHWMYSDLAAQNRLQMCDRCRIQDLFLRKKPDSVSVESGNP
jgi:ferredoxin